MRAIALGAMAPPLKEQLAGCLDDKTLEIMQQDADAITRLLIRGFIPESIATKARVKLTKAIRAKLA